MPFIEIGDYIKESLDLVDHFGAFMQNDFITDFAPFSISLNLFYIYKNYFIKIFSS